MLQLRHASRPMFALARRRRFRGEAAAAISTPVVEGRRLRRIDFNGCHATVAKDAACARAVSSAVESAEVGAALNLRYADRVAEGNLAEDAAQRKVVEFMASALEKACTAIKERRESSASGREAWAWPTRTLGLSGVASGDAERIAAYTASLAALNRQRVRRQRARGEPPATDAATDTSESAPTTVSATPAAATIEKPLDSRSNTEQSPPVSRPERRSMYLHGSVGTGKTMLLDLFHTAAQDSGLRTSRQHFYEFMLSFHEQIHRTEEERPVEVIANTLADQVDVLCFDEFQITDIQDASILPRLFEVLFLRGVVVVMTSNTAPQLLYSGGLNRHVYIPAFVSLLGEHCVVLGLGGRRAVDYRRKAEVEELEEAAAGTSAAPRSDVYLTGAEGDDLLMGRWGERLASAGVAAGNPRVLGLTMGRSLRIADSAGDACLVRFEELCASDRGEADFLALATAFRTIFLRGVPSFSVLEDTDLVRRFVKLLDVLYDRRIQLVIAAAAPPAELFEGVRAEVSKGDMGDLAWRTAMYSADGRAGMAPSAVGTLCEAVRATERAESRLREMRTRKYWDACAATHPA